MRKRTGTLIMVVGVVLAVVAGLMVFAVTRQARAERTAQVEQVLVVMAAQDIADGSVISSDGLTMKPFPAEFVPPGAIVSPEDAIGKYSTTFITKGQIVLANQFSQTRRTGNLALSVPSGKVAIALPMTDLMSTSGAIMAGDRVDILLTINLKEIQIKDPLAEETPVVTNDSNARNPVTQTTLQNVEVIAVGQIEGDEYTSGTSATTAGSTATNRVPPAVIVLLDPQDALVLKYAKDSGGVVDLALRAPGDTEQNTTDPITIDHLFERFNFQRPGPLP